MCGRCIFITFPPFHWWQPTAQFLHCKLPIQLQESRSQRWTVWVQTQKQSSQCSHRGYQAYLQRGGRAREWRLNSGYRLKKTGETMDHRMELLRRCPLAIVQWLVHRAIAVSTAMLCSHKDNVHCTAVEQPEAKEVQLLQPSSASLLLISSGLTWGSSSTSLSWRLDLTWNPDSRFFSVFQRYLKNYYRYKAEILHTNFA